MQMPALGMPFRVSHVLRESLMRTCCGTPLLVLPSGRSFYVNYAMRALLLVVVLRCRQVVEIGEAWSDDCGEFVQGRLFS